MAKSNLGTRIIGWLDHLRAFRLARQVAAHSHPNPQERPIVMFNATARLGGLSQNAAFSLFTGWGLRLSGAPVKHFVCKAGMSHCVLGTSRQDHRTPPPCDVCQRQSRRLYSGADVHWFEYTPETALVDALQNLRIDELSRFEYPFEFQHQSPTAIPNKIIPLGKLVLPSIRWSLRRHTLPDNEQTHYLLAQYILSAYNVAKAFDKFLEVEQPSTAVIFNGTMYPEAAARWVALERGLPVVTHEVGFQQFSAFFTYEESTAYPIHIPDTFEMSPEQNALLDEYLAKRFQGQFTMAGIRFWPEMRGLDDEFLQKAGGFRQIVSVFTNVAYDTSQAHAHSVFPNMFAWLELILELIRSHPDTLFVIRAHPDEMRTGTAKLSRESVQDWVIQNSINELPNVVFIAPQEYISSYELIQRSKFVIVYNSSIGMEATLMGAPVLCGGKSRYTRYPIVFFPDNVQAFRQKAEEFLSSDSIDIPSEFKDNARRFLYYQLFCASLYFEDYLEEGARKGYVRLKTFPWSALLPENSTSVKILLEGITAPPDDEIDKSQVFLWPDDYE